MDELVATVLDFSAAFPSGASIKAAGHDGVVAYISPPREEWMGAKPLTRAVVEDYRAHDLGVAAVWQFGSGNNPDVRRGARGGELDARNADAWLEQIGLAGHPVFFAVDFDVTLAEWNSTVVKYFRAACDVLGRDRVGIYGHSRVVHWAMEDGVVATVAPGRVLGWVTRSWQSLNADGSAKGRDYAVLFQGVHNTPGPDGVQVDVNDVWHEYWGQYRPELRPRPAVEVMRFDEYLTLRQDRWTSGRGGQRIEYVTRHHMGGIGDGRQCIEWWQSRVASAHAAIDRNGKRSQIIAPEHTAWSNADAHSNRVSYSIEHSNSAGPGQDWPISDATIREGARLAAEVCYAHDLGRPEFGKNIRDHDEFTGTECPYHLRDGHKYHDRWLTEAQNHYDYIVASVQAGHEEEGFTMAEANEIKGLLQDVRQQLTGAREYGQYPGWPQLGKNEQGQDLTLVDGVAFLRRDVAALHAEVTALRTEVQDMRGGGGRG